MKKNLKTGLCVLAATAFLSTGGYFGIDYGKKWVNNKVNNAVTEAIKNYEQTDKNWTETKFNEGINQYEQKDNNQTNQKFNENKQWTNKSIEQALTDGIKKYNDQDKNWTSQNFEKKMPLEQLAKAFNSTYMIVNWGTFVTATGEKIEGPLGTGSGILLNGGYFLTAGHVTQPDVPKELNHPIYGTVKLDHFEYSLTNERASENTKKSPIIEEIIAGKGETMDYAILKLKEPSNLTYYDKGIEMPKKLEVGNTTIAIGFPLALGRNVRIGNISQTDSDMGKDCITYKNDILPSDSGGPLFIIENGELKLAAVSVMGLQIPQGLGVQFVNINVGVKIEEIIKDVEAQISSGKLDQKTAAELTNFLKLNKK